MLSGVEIRIGEGAHVRARLWFLSSDSPSLWDHFQNNRPVDPVALSGAALHKRT